MRCTIYARYSSDLQREASIGDQLRVCRARADREGWTVVEGEISERHIGLKGTMGALYLKDFAQKTRRGQQGRVLAGRCLGTASYGYRVVRRLADTGELGRGLREIVPDEAAVVRRIFNAYVAGVSPRGISKTLNHEKVPGPSGGVWYAATIRGRPDRGEGLLRNPIYIGRLVWARCTRRKDPFTGRRVQMPPEADAGVSREVPQLRIIDQDLWDRALARLASPAVPQPATADAPTPSAFVAPSSPVSCWTRSQPG